MLQSELGLRLNQIQIYPTNQYTPAVHRLLQVAANLWDAKTNRQDAFGPLPTVFAPRFMVSNNSVFLTGYVEVETTNDLSSLPPLDLAAIAPANLATVVSNDSLIFGVPLVIGARKGLPNFNEFAMDARFTVGRYLELRKSAPGGQNKIYQTNQIYTLNIAVECGAEFWNSYRSNYTRPVNILANNRLTISLSDDHFPTSPPVITNVLVGGETNTTTGTPWLAWSGAEAGDAFIVPFRTNVTLFAPATVAYQPGSGGFTIQVGTNYEVDARLLLPNWGLAIANRVQAVITDQATGRIIDYVLLGDMTYQTNLTSMFVEPVTSRGFSGVWATNMIGNQLSGRLGVIQQLLISMGNATVFSSPPNDWEFNYGNFPPNRVYEIAKFGAFFLPLGVPGSFNDPSTGEFATAINTNLIAYAPFTPMVTFNIPISWQANDPLVHYLGHDMLDLKNSGIAYRIKPPGNDNAYTMANIGLKNPRYQPWDRNPSSDPNAFNSALKDPLVRSSDDWRFPTNECTTIGQLSQIHRGTPWQTIYLKSADVSSNSWRSWTSNLDGADAQRSRPVRDWSLAATIASLLNTNAPQQLLSINNPDTNAWLDVLDGLSVLTNVLSHTQLLANTPAQFDSLIVTSNSAQAESVVASIFATRAGQSGGIFRSVGAILASPALSLASPWLSQSSSMQLQRGLTDEAYECLPAQLLSLVRADSIGVISSVSGGSQIQFTGFDGYAYAVECSTNLMQWTTVSTNYPTNGVFTVTDDSASAGQRYYRSVLQP